MATETKSAVEQFAPEASNSRTTYSASVWGAERGQKKKRYTAPWTRQGMEVKADGTTSWMGIPGNWRPLQKEPRRSPWGGWLDEDEYDAAYTSHASSGGKGAMIGTYLGAADARNLLKGAFAAPMPPQGKHVKPEGVGSDQLHGLSEEMFAWGSGTGNWLPRAGCMSCGDWGETGLNQPHAFNAPADLHHLPLVMKPKEHSEEDAAIIDALVQNQFDSGMAVRWKPEHGLPSVVSNVRVIHQYDSKGRMKPRVITDLRYVNATVDPIAMMLPTVTGIARQLRPGDLVAKQGAAAGYTQMEMVKRDRHLMTFFWRGIVVTATAEMFGARCAPGAYVMRTERACEDALQATPGVTMARVYVDDWVSRYRPGLSGEALEAEHQKWIASLVSKGIVLSRSKCLPPSTKCEVLGLDVDTEAMTITVPPVKSQRYVAQLREMAAKAEERPIETREVAALLGRLNSVEAAVPQVLLLMRPLMEDLKRGLAEANSELAKLKEIPQCRTAAEAHAHYEWIDLPINVGATARRAMENLAKNWSEFNGQKIRRRATTLVIATDASDTGIGVTIYVVSVKGELEKIDSFSLALSMEEAAQSSTCREAVAQLRAVERLKEEHPDKLEGAVLEMITDNMGLARRYAMGSTAFDFSELLIDIHELLRGSRAVWAATHWLPRDQLGEEDRLSRESRVRTEDLRVTQEWFERFKAALAKDQRRLPTIDGFATKENAVCERYVSRTPGEGNGFDGTRHQWRAREVPWLFPPVHAIAAAVENWRTSAPEVAYVCVPAVKPGHQWLRGIQALAPIPCGEAEVEGIPEGASRWRFRVLALIKRKRMSARGEVRGEEGSRRSRSADGEERERRGVRRE